MQGIGPTSGLLPYGLDSRMTRNVIGGKAEKRISIDGIGGVFIYANDAKTLSNWYAHHFGLKLETYEDGKVTAPSSSTGASAIPQRWIRTVFSISQAKTTLRPSAVNA